MTNLSPDDASMLAGENELVGCAIGDGWKIEIVRGDSGAESAWIAAQA